MNGKRIETIFVAFVAVVFVGMAVGWGGMAVSAGGAGRAGQAASEKAAAGGAAAGGQMTAEERAGLLAKGKAIFVEKCAKCHNERGDKALSSGKPLNERGLETETIARAVGGRLKDRTEEERRAVTVYIASLMKKE
jgi:mono/diheme cytochrome c family protein